jgi:uncharacterized membrane protein
VKEWLTFITEYAVLMIDALALVVIAVATIEAFINGLRLMSPSLSRHEWRDVWLRYSRWLVAGLTFQLAADIIETSITTSWDAVGRIAAVRRHSDVSQLLPRTRSDGSSPASARNREVRNRRRYAHHTFVAGRQPARPPGPEFSRRRRSRGGRAGETRC